MRALLLLFAFSIVVGLEAQRPMEQLDRALVVQGRNSGGTFLTWRMLGTDPRNISFNIYRNDVKINNNPIEGATNYIDHQGSINASYKLETIWEDRENEFYDKPILFPLSTEPDRARIPIKRIPITPPVVGDLTFIPGSMSVGDLTGDGTYELVFEWQSNIGTHSVLEAIDLDGNSLWKIYLGPNSDMRKLNFMVYDLNMDGKAEVAMMTGPGTMDGIGNFISKGAAADYPSDLIIERGWGNNLLYDPKFITVFDGETGAEMATTEFWPPIGPMSTHQQIWGDDRGHRASSLKGGVLYNIEHGPLLVFQRGVYTRVAVSTYKWDGAEGLDIVWKFDSYDGHPEYNYQANHSPAIGDLDGDGNDEYLPGPAAINHDGTPMWTTRMGHGDATHLGKHIPDRAGLQFFMPHENNVNGISMTDAATGEVIWDHKSPGDVGRAWAADYDPRYRGSEVVAIGFPNYNSLGELLSTNYNSYHQPIYFDGTTNRDLRVQGWGIESYAHGRILTGWHYGATPNHGTKQDACLVADIMGDWREEVIYRNSNNRELIIFSSWFPTERKNPTLMHDYIYRMNTAIQNVGYNQPAHTSYYFRDGYPDHDIYMVERSISAMRSGNFYLYPVHSSLVLDANEGLTQQEFEGSGDQVFHFRRDGDAFSIYNYGSDKYLGYTEAQEGMQLILTDEPSKRMFKLVKESGTDYYYIYSADDENLVIAVESGSVSSGSGLLLAQVSGGEHDKFTFVSAGMKFDCSGAWDGDAYLDNCAICVEGNSGKYPNSEKLEAGFYRIKSLDTDRYLYDTGSRIGSAVGSDDDTEIWELVKDGVYFKLISKNPRKTIHFINNDIYLGTNLTNPGNLRIEEKVNDEEEVVYIFTQRNSDMIVGFEDNIQNDASLLKALSRTSAGNQMFVFEAVELETSIDQTIRTNSGVRIYPNPANNYFNLAIEESISVNARYEIFSATGRLIKSQVIKETITHVSLGNLDPGIYIIRVSNNSLIQHLKFVKQ